MFCINEEEKDDYGAKANNNNFWSELQGILIASTLKVNVTFISHKRLCKCSLNCNVVIQLVVFEAIGAVNLIAISTLP